MAQHRPLLDKIETLDWNEETLKFCGGVAMQGSPILLANSLIAGMSAFLAEPAKARTPGAFARGVATGAPLPLAAARMLPMLHVCTGKYDKAFVPLAATCLR
jgi:hypothetical protein